MWNSRKVHNLLHRTRAEHGETSLAASHHILVVAKDAERVAGQCACAHVEHAGQHFACNLIHVGNHEQQTLRCSECGCECTGLQRAVQGTGSATFRLHFLNCDVLAPQILSSAGCPLVNVLRHGRRRGDGVDSCYLREHIAHMSRSLVTITSDKLFFFSHLLFR